MLLGCRIVLFNGVTGSAIPFACPAAGDIWFGNATQSGMGASTAVTNYSAQIRSYELPYSTPTPPPIFSAEYENPVYYQTLYDSDAGKYQQTTETYQDWVTLHSDDPSGYFPTNFDLLLERVAHIETMLMPSQEPSVFGSGTELITGTNFVSFPGIWGVDIDVTALPGTVDNWWGEPDTGRFGVLVPVFSGTRYGAVQFINFESTRFLIPQL